MKLKYYLRGLGIGVFFTTVIFMFVVSMHKNDAPSQSNRVPETESKTVAQYENNTQKASSWETTETEQPLETEQPTETESTQPKVEPETEPTEPTPETEKAEPPKQPETQEEKKADKVRLEIKGGEYSDVVCRKLEMAGLVDNAAAFNKFLVDGDYDNAILPGVYDIPPGSTYEEIAVLLTTKVE